MPFNLGDALSGLGGFAKENPSTIASGLNLAATFAGGDSNKIAASQGLINSMTAANAAKDSEKKRAEMFQQLINALGGGGLTPAGTGGGTDLKLSSGEDGAVTGMLTGDLLTPTKDANTATQGDLISGKSVDTSQTGGVDLRSLLPF